MWNIKNKEAVSPVIGVILMVAITVVLAAVLYVWVSGFMGGGGAATPTAALSAPSATCTEAANNTTSKVISISTRTAESDVKWYVYTSAGVSKASGTVSEAYVTTNGISVRLYDNDDDDRISTNDIFQIYESATGTIVAGDAFVLIHSTTGGEIARATFT